MSDPEKTGRRWNLPEFLETGRQEISVLMHRLQTLGLNVSSEAALDFGCGVGRLSQALGAYFERVVGIDISSEMIRLANDINQRPTQVRYVCNAQTDLGILADNEFSLIYSIFVLQHIAPANALRYLSEFFRVLAPGGVLVFQLPSHVRPPEERRPQQQPMAQPAYRAAVKIESDIPPSVAPGTTLALAATVTNTSPHLWSLSESGAIRLGNHWLSGADHVMVVPDDGRALLPERIVPGETCRVVLNVTVPSQPGEYELQCDLVHEGVSWFADKGSEPWRRGVRVAGSSDIPISSRTRNVTPAKTTLALPDISSIPLPGPMPMYGIPRDEVTRFIAERDATLAQADEDDTAGREWVGYRYFVRKND